MALERMEPSAEKKQIQEIEERRHAEEIARIKAETENEVRQRIEEERRSAVAAVPSAPVELTEAQWLQAEEETGKTRDQIKKDARFIAQFVDGAVKPLRGELEETRKKLKDADARYAKLELSKKSESIISDFYEKNPQYKQHHKAMADYLEMFPEEMRQDSKKLEVLLEKGKTYVRGSVREGTVKTRDEEGSLGLGGNDEGGDEGLGEPSSDKIDFTGLKTVAEKRMIADLHAGTQRREIEEPELAELHKKTSSDDGLGVEYGYADEFRAGNKLMKLGIKAARRNP